MYDSKKARVHADKSYRRLGSTTWHLISAFSENSTFTPPLSLCNNFSLWNWGFMAMMYALYRFWLCVLWIGKVMCFLQFFLASRIRSPASRDHNKLQCVLQLPCDSLRLRTLNTHALLAATRCYAYHAQPKLHRVSKTKTADVSRLSGLPTTISMGSTSFLYHWFTFSVNGCISCSTVERSHWYSFFNIGTSRWVLQG